MATIKMKPPTSDVDARACIQIDCAEPIFIGELTGKEYLCHQCGVTIMRDMEARLVVDVVLICGGCGAHNETGYNDVKHLSGRKLNGPLTFTEGGVYYINGSVNVHQSVLVCSRKVALTFDLVKGDFQA